MSRNSSLKHRYGITEDEFIQRAELQGGLCICCGQGGKRLCVDHDHVTGEVRGLICYSCNLFIGQIENDPLKVAKVIHYLEAFQIKVMVP